METMQPPHRLSRNGVFAENFVTALNHAAIMLSCSLGHRTGLFDAMAELDWATPDEIARSARLNPRYVREWLGAMATGGVVDTDGERYHLPPAHAASLTRAAGPANLAVFAQNIAVLGEVESEIARCFVTGDGVPYERFSRFHEVMAEESSLTVLSVLEEEILPLVPGLIDQLEAGIRVLDVGCGRGLALLQMAERFPRSEFSGIDLSEEAVSWARSEAERRSLTNASFGVHDATNLHETAAPGAYDFVTTFDAVHDQARPLNVLKGIARTLRPRGVYLMQDIRASSHVHENVDHPMGALLYTVSFMHCMSVSLAQGGEGLGTMWGRQQAMAYLTEAGFRDIEIHELPHDIQNDYYVARL